MKQTILKKILLGCVLTTCSCICFAQRLAIKSNLLGWGLGYVNLETEWVNRHPFSNNIGYFFSLPYAHHTGTRIWYDCRYWISGRSTFGTALGFGVVYAQRSVSGSRESKPLLRSDMGLRGSLIRCWTLTPHWSLETRIETTCFCSSTSVKIDQGLHQFGVSLMYIIH